MPRKSFLQLSKGKVIFTETLQICIFRQLTNTQPTIAGASLNFNLMFFKIYLTQKKKKLEGLSSFPWSNSLENSDNKEGEKQECLTFYFEINNGFLNLDKNMKLKPP